MKLICTILGASIVSILKLLSKDYVTWILLANIISWPVTYFAMQKWLQNYPYRTSIDPSIFPMAGLLALFIALLTVIFQSIRAARANPVDALKYE